MESSATSQKYERKDYLDAFATAVARLREQKSDDEILAQVPVILCSEFSALRSEVWLWDEPSRSGYLTHAAGAEAKHWRDYITHDSGSLGHAAASFQPVHNLVVAEAGKDSFDFVQRARLTHTSVFPIAANGRVIAVSVNYSDGPTPTDAVTCWRAFADIAGLALQSNRRS